MTDTIKPSPCIFHLIRSWQSISQPQTTASVVSCTAIDIVSDGRLFIVDMTHDVSCRYLVNMFSADYRSYDIYDGRLADDGVRLSKVGSHRIRNIDGEDTRTVMVEASGTVKGVCMSELMDTVRVRGRCVECRVQMPINGRWFQQRGEKMYMISKNDELYVDDIANLKENKKVNKETMVFVEKGVEDFFVCENGDLGYIDVKSVLRFPKNKMATLKVKLDRLVPSILTKIAGIWIACFSIGTTAIIASVSNNGRVITELNIKMTGNGFQGRLMEGDPFMFCLKTVAQRRRQAILLAVEREGCYHLLLLNKRGELSLLQRCSTLIDATVVSQFQVVMAVAQTATRGEFIVSGHNWMALLKIKFS